MIKCVACGNDLVSTAKFCTKCGTKVEMEAQNQLSSNDFKEAVSVKQIPEEMGNEEKVPGNRQITIDTQKIEGMTKSYFNFLNDGIKHPRLDGRGNSYNGLISFGLISLFSSLGVSHMVGSGMSEVSRVADRYTMGAFSEVAGSPQQLFPGWLSIFILILAMGFIPVLTSYVLTSKTFGQGFSLLGVFNRIYTPVGVGVYVTAAILILSFIGNAMSNIALVGLEVIPTMLISTSFVVSLITGTLADSSTKRFYKILAALICNFVAMMLVFMIIAPKVALW